MNFGNPCVVVLNLCFDQINFGEDLCTIIYLDTLASPKHVGHVLFPGTEA
jgi:hypothetical protein